MKDKIKSLFASLHIWQIMLLSIVGTVLITDLITSLLSLWIWHEIQFNLIVLGTINAILVPLIMLPTILRNMRHMVKLEEQNRDHMEKISILESEHQIEATLQRRADEMLLLYRLGISLAAGRDLTATLLALQNEIVKLIQVDALFVAIYDEVTDIVEYPVFFTKGEPVRYPARLISERPGLTGAVIFGGKTLYLPDTLTDEVVNQFAPVDDQDLGLHTFLGIPLVANGRAMGVLSVQSVKVDAYTSDQIQFMENVAVQAALAIDKANLLDQVKQELADRKRVETELRERDVILEAVTFAAEQFLKSSDWRETIDSVLEKLGRAIHASHAYICEQHLNPLGERVQSVRFQWTAEAYATDLGNPEFQNIPLLEPGFEEYYQTLKTGEPFIGNATSFRKAEREHFSAFGIKAVLEVPLIVSGQWWGTIGFDDYGDARDWSNTEVDALKIAAGVLSAAVQRVEAEGTLRESELIFRRAIEAADAVPYYLNYKSNSYLFMGKGIYAMTGYSPEEMHPEVWPEIVEESIMLDEAAGLSAAEAIELVRRGMLRAWKCDQKIRTRDGQIRWLTDRSIELLDEHGSSQGAIGILQDITDRKIVEADSRQREAMLAATTFAAEQFIKTSDWRLNIDNVLEQLGKTFHVTHAYLFEHSIGMHQVEYSRLKYEWTADGYKSDFDNPYYKSSHPIRLEDGSTDQALRQGIVFMGNISTFPPSERERLFDLGVKAMVEVPLFVDENWWGTLGLDDFEDEREWNNAEVDALKIAVGILSATIQRQGAEAAVRESERIYRQAIEAAGAVPYYRDYRQNRYSFMGNEIEKMIGYKPEEVTFDLWKNIIKENIALGDGEGLQFQEAVTRMRTGVAKIWKSDMRVIARNGEERWITDSAVGLFDDSDLSYASIGILQDITDRKQTEAKLHKRESILEAMTFAAEQFLKTANWRERIDIVLERLGRELNASHAYLFEKYKAPDGKLMSSMTYEWTAPGRKTDLDDPVFLNMPPQPMGFDRLYDTLDRGEPLVASTAFFTEAEWEYMKTINVKALLEMRVVVNGEHWGTIGFDEVIHEREWSVMEVEVLKVAANVLGAAIQRQMDESALQHELNQRTMLVEELESKNTELERFTYTVSHDLKSPLVTINGFLGYLEQDAVSGNMERLRKDTQRIQEAVDKMQRLLSELLELSRVGRMMNTPETISFNDLAMEAMNIVHGQLEARGVTVQIQPAMPAVYGDKPRLTEALQNLLDNAAKYMGAQPNPHIEIGQQGAERGQLVFYIKDNGIGIAPEFYERVFGLFNKLDPKSEGTGVGLALVKRIIEVHGGRIWLESELGAGSVFYFTLPVKESSE